MFGFFFLTIRKPLHRVCERDSNGKVTRCRNETWDPNLAQIPCSFLPPKFVECVTHSFDKFQNEFEPGTLPENGCPSNNNEHMLGIAVCHPLNGIKCIGEQYWLNTTYPCITIGSPSVTCALLLSFFLGFLGADRFYLGHHFIAFLKLTTLGGFGIGWIIDFILLVAGVWGPNAGHYGSFY